MVQDLLRLKFLHDVAECGAAQKLGERGELAYESSPPVEVQLAGIDCQGRKPDSDSE
jgi:hypothetical protein